ncbi:MAG: hypothetical protein RBR07_02460 [Arcobacteraceae bacterium]|jgi:hypothetical protein|nr:hypothetical protein [Arcobacteraceae bacterium]
MERRDRALKALNELTFIDSQDAPQRAEGLTTWVSKYLDNDGIYDFDLNLEDLKRLSELIYKNLEFLKAYKNQINESIIETTKIKRFILNKH